MHTDNSFNNLSVNQQGCKKIYCVLKEAVTFSCTITSDKYRPILINLSTLHSEMIKCKTVEMKSEIVHLT